jgi:DNA-binding CsgD family transcriptional regulator
MTCEAAQAKLSSRELDVVSLICEGKNGPDIAQILGISPNTVRAHRRVIFAKLGVNSIALLVRWYLENERVARR